MLFTEDYIYASVFIIPARAGETTRPICGIEVALGMTRKCRQMATGKVASEDLGSIQCCGQAFPNMLNALNIAEQAGEQGGRGYGLQARYGSFGGLR